MRARRGSRLQLTRQVSEIIDPYEGMGLLAKSWSQFYDAAQHVAPDVAAVYLATFLFALCVQIQLPVLPFIVKERLGQSTMSLGYLRATYGAMQVLGSLLSPRLMGYSTKFLLVSHVASVAVACLLTAYAPSMLFLYLARIPAMWQQGLAISRGYAAQRCPAPGLRDQHVAFVSAAYSVGFVLGPVVGGFFASYFAIVAAPLVGVAGAGLAFLVLYYVIDEDADVVDSSPGDVPTESLTMSCARGMSAVAGNPTLGRLFLTKAVFVIAHSIFLSAMPLLVWESLGGSVYALGVIMTATAVTGAVVDTAIIPELVEHFSDVGLQLGAVAVAVFGLLLMTVTSSLWVFGIGGCAVTAAAMLHGVVLPAQLSEAPNPDDTDAVRTLDVIATTAIRAICHLIAAQLLTSGGVLSVALVSVAAALTAAFLAQSRETVLYASGKMD